MNSNINFKSLNLKNIDFKGIKNFLLNFLVPVISLLATLVMWLLVLKPSYKDLPNLKSD